MKVILSIAVVLCASSGIFAQCNSFVPFKENVKYEYEMFDKKEGCIAAGISTVSK